MALRKVNEIISLPHFLSGFQKSCLRIWNPTRNREIYPRDQERSRRKCIWNSLDWEMFAMFTGVGFGLHRSLGFSLWVNQVQAYQSTPVSLQKQIVGSLPALLLPLLFHLISTPFLWKPACFEIWGAWNVEEKRNPGCFSWVLFLDDTPIVDHLLTCV